MGWTLRIVCACLALAGSSASALADTYTYDALGRLTSHQTTAGVLTTYIYDPAGNRTAVVTTSTPVNQAPNAVDDTIVRNEGAGPLSIPVLANDTDPEGQALTITNVTQPQFGSAAISGSNVTYTGGPSANQLSQTDSFTYSIQDTGGLNDSAVINVVLTNLAPVLGNDAITVPRNGSLTFDPRTNDSDPGGDPITVTGVTQPSSGSAAFTGSSVTYTTAPAFSGSTSFTYSASDGQGGAGSATIAVTVTATNTAPIALDDVFGPVYWGQSQNYDVRFNDSDPDGDALIVVSVGDPSPNVGTAGVGFNGTSVFYEAPAFGFTGSVTFSYTISDGQGGTATAIATVDVEQGN